jgi:hypothetical protein
MRRDSFWLQSKPTGVESIMREGRAPAIARRTNTPREKSNEHDERSSQDLFREATVLGCGLVLPGSSTAAVPSRGST